MRCWIPNSDRTGTRKRPIINNNDGDDDDDDTMRNNAGNENVPYQKRKNVLRLYEILKLKLNK